jgi:hypothetical protein
MNQTSVKIGKNHSKSVNFCIGNFFDFLPLLLLFNAFTNMYCIYQFLLHLRIFTVVKSEFY